MVEYNPNKSEKERTRITVGGNRINYPEDCGTPTADMLLVKLMIDSVISTPGAAFMTLDIKKFYLNTPLKRFEYLKLQLADLLEDVIEHYQLKDMETPEGCFYVEIRKGMYGLLQAGLLTQELLKQRLNKHGYSQSQFTPGLWTHQSRPICFSLVFNDFGVKYKGKEHDQHLVSILKKHYEVSEDWEGKKIYWTYV